MTAKPKLRSIPGGGGTQPPKPPKRRSLNKTDAIKLYNLIDNMLLDGVPMRRIEYVCGLPESQDKPIPSVGVGLVRQIVTLARNEWKTQFYQERAAHKQQMIQRLMRNISEARKDRKWHAVRGLEDLRARVLGLYEADRITVEFGRATGIANSIAALTEDEVHQRAREMMEIKHQADLYRQSIMNPEAPLTDLVRALPPATPPVVEPVEVEAELVETDEQKAEARERQYLMRLRKLGLA